METDTKQPAETGCSLDSLVMRLERVAKANDDDFRYKITVEPNRKGIVYFFVCEEKADGHTLLTGCGTTIDEAVKQSWNDIESSCEEWGYEPVA